MKYYQHHIGDFDRATRHLTRLERSIYRDLIELYYDTEQPLTLDRVALCRKILARSNEEATAVEQTLNEFFTETSTGWYHERCEAEIERYHNSTSQKAQAGKASALKREAKKQQALNGNPTAVEQTLNGTPTNQQPLTNNQEPVIKTPAPKSARFDPQWLPTPIGLKQEKWVEWVLYRSRIGKKPKAETWQKQIEFLADCVNQGFDPGAIIDESIRNGWQGLFAPKGQARASPYESEKDRSRRQFAEAIFGKAKHEPANELDITGIAQRLD